MCSTSDTILRVKGHIAVSYTHLEDNKFLTLVINEKPNKFKLKGEMIGGVINAVSYTHL